jgi:uncharacterized protein (TIGR02145 family)
MRFSPLGRFNHVGAAVNSLKSYWTQQIGTIITDDFARESLGANWDITSLSTVSAACDGSKLILSHTGANTSEEAVLWKDLMSLENWECEIIVKPSEKSANSYGSAIRFSSSDTVNKFNMSVTLNMTTDATYGGLLFISNNDNTGILYQCPTKVTITNGCSYSIYAKREKNVFTIRAENLTDHSSASGSYTYPTFYSTPDKSFLINQGKLGFQSVSGAINMTYEVTYCNINSVALLHPKTNVIGDSISAGGYVSNSIEDRYYDRLFGNTITYYNLMATGGAKIADLVLREAEVVRYKPKYALVMVGANDSSTNHTEWQTSYETYLDYLITNGITPIVCYPTPQTNDITWMNTVIDSICAARSVKVINTFTPLKAVANNTLHADYNGGDGLHPNSAGHTLISSTIITAAPELLKGTVLHTEVKDADGNTYTPVVIGTQTWLQQSLKTTKYNNGDAIPNETVGATWAGLTTGAYCWYNNDKATYGDEYGVLYNGYVVKDARGVAPAGYHIATAADWATLSTYLGGNAVSGGKLKEIGTEHWQNNAALGSNEVRFLGIGNGQRLVTSGNFGYVHQYNPYWTSTIFDATHNTRYYLAYDSLGIGTDDTSHLSCGHLIRCVKD